MVGATHATATGIAILSTLCNVAASPDIAGDGGFMESRDIMEHSTAVPEMRDLDDVETRAALDGDSDLAALDKRLFPFIGLAVKAAVKAGAKKAAKKAAKKGAKKGGKDAGSHKAKEKHREHKHKKNNKPAKKGGKKKGRRSLDGGYSLLDSRDILDGFSELSFDARDFDEDVLLETRRLPALRLGKPSRVGGLFSSMYKTAGKSPKFGKPSRSSGSRKMKAGKHSKFP